MKKLRTLIILLITLCLIPVAAAAVNETEGVTIQLNGETMALPGGAQPWIDPDSGRAYVPFRDLFQAMGAEVTYDADTRIITAVRGETTVQFSQNGGDITITAAGEAYTLEMDVPPVTREGRILVPIRFASQALGARVGWDSAARTVLVADIPAVVEARLGSYEIIGSVLGLWELDAAKHHQVDMNLSLLADIAELLGYSTSEPMPVEGTLSAVMGPDGMDGTGTLTADVSALLKAIPGLSGNVSLSYDAGFIWNRETGLFYLQCPALAEYMELARFGLEDMNAWLQYDLSHMADELDVSALLGGAATLGGTGRELAATLMESALEGYSLYSVDSYGYMLEALDEVNRLIEDSAFTLEDGVWVNTYTIDEDDYSGRLAISIPADATRCTVTYEMDYGYESQAMEITLTRNSAAMTMALAGETELTLALDMTWAVTTEKPRTAPPKDAPVADPEALEDAYIREMLNHYTPVFDDI